MSTLLFVIKLAYVISVIAYMGLIVIDLIAAKRDQRELTHLDLATVIIIGLIPLVNLFLVITVLISDRQIFKKGDK